MGELGLILHTSDGGATWEDWTPEFFKALSFEEEMDSMDFVNPSPSMFSIYFTDKNNGWACGLDSTIIHTTDGGKTWKELENDGMDPLYTIYVKGNTGWAVGDKGSYLMSTDGGKTWKLQPTAIKSKLWFRDVFFSSPEKGWVTGARGTVVHTTDGGKSWDFYSGFSYEFEGFQLPERLEARVVE